MMALVPFRRSARLPLFGAAFAVLLSAGVGLYATRDPRGEVIAESADASGWKTLAYEGVSVDIPSDWKRLDMGDCEFRFERWAPPGVPPCDPDAEGIAFYGSATLTRTSAQASSGTTGRTHRSLTGRVMSTPVTLPSTHLATTARSWKAS